MPGPWITDSIEEICSPDSESFVEIVICFFSGSNEIVKSFNLPLKILESFMCETISDRLAIAIVLKFLGITWS